MVEVWKGDHFVWDRRWTVEKVEWWWPCSVSFPGCAASLPLEGDQIIDFWTGVSRPKVWGRSGKRGPSSAARLEMFSKHFATARRRLCRPPTLPSTDRYLDSVQTYTRVNLHWATRYNIYPLQTSKVKDLHHNNHTCTRAVNAHVGWNTIKLLLLLLHWKQKELVFSVAD